jgi:hypothetical protein
MDIETISKPNQDDLIIPEFVVTVNDLKRHKKQINCSLIAKVLLRNFDRSHLVHTKSGNLNMRSKKNKLYMKLVELSECEELGNEKWKKELFSMLPLNKDGTLDLSYQVNKDYIQEVIDFLS